MRRHGALSGLKRYADGGEVDTDTDPEASSYGQGDFYEEDAPEGEPASYGSPEAIGAIGADTPDYERYLGQFAGALTGSPEEVAGALSQSRSDVQAKTQMQKDLIQRAQQRIATMGQPDPDMVRQAWAIGLRAPVHSGSPGFEGLANASAAEMQERIRQQNIQRQNAVALGNLDLTEGKVGVQGAKDDYGLLKDRLTLARQAAEAAARNQAYRASIEERRQAAAAAAQARVDAANAAAEQRAQAAQQASQDRADALAERVRQDDLLADARNAGRYQYQPGTGPDPDDPAKQVQGIWRLPTRGDEEPTFSSTGTIERGGRGGVGSGATALEKNARFYVENGIAKDIPSAVAMLRQGVNDAATFQRLVQAEKKLLTSAGKVNPATGKYIGPYSDAEAEAAARQNVTARTQSALMQPPTLPSAPTAVHGPANTAANPGFPMLTPAPAAVSAPIAPAVRPATPAPAVAPAPVAPAAVPPRPPNVPPTAKYSPSRHSWWWQESGVWKSAPG